MASRGTTGPLPGGPFGGLRAGASRRVRPLQDLAAVWQACGRLSPRARRWASLRRIRPVIRSGASWQKKRRSARRRALGWQRGRSRPEPASPARPAQAPLPRPPRRCELNLARVPPRRLIGKRMEFQCFDVSITVPREKYTPPQRERQREAERGIERERGREAEMRRKRWGDWAGTGSRKRIAVLCQGTKSRIFAFLVLGMRPEIGLNARHIGS